MIAVEVAGRLGNQMFIYAYALAASHRLGCGYFLMYNWRDPSCFQLPQYFKCPSFHPLQNRLKFSAFNVLGAPFPVVEVDATAPPDQLIAKEARFRRFRGYMQSEIFFAGCENVVRSEFQIRDEFRKAFLDRYGERGDKKRIVVHVRRSDYAEFGKPELGYDLRLPVSYYETCFQRIEGLDRAEVFFVGDDVEFCRRVFGDKLSFRETSGSLMNDFQLLQSADVAVISNSSFAWWAAYLASNRAIHVYAPRYWFGFKVRREYPVGIMYPGWEWMDVL